MTVLLSRENILTKIQEEQNRNTNTLHMTANENVLSKTVRNLLSSNLSYRYYSDIYDKTVNLTDAKYYTVGNAMYRGLPAVYEFESIARHFANEMFHANFSDFSPLSGMHAVMCILIAITRPADKVFILTPESLGHHATRFFLEKIGRQVLFIPWDEENLCIDLATFSKLFEENKDAIIFLDLGTTFYPLPLKKIREIVGYQTKIIYDGSHVLGLIAGGEFQNPLQEGCDILIGNTHKTFPGPQKAMMLFKDEELGRVIAADLYKTTVSSQHTHQALALYLTILEMAEHAKAYAKQIVNNARVFSNALIAQGFKLTQRINQLPVSHMVAITNPFKIDHQYACSQLQDVEISANTKRIFHQNSVRLGVQEITRRGMQASDMEMIASFFRQILIEHKPNMSLVITEFNKQFNKVHYSFDK